MTSLRGPNPNRTIQMKFAVGPIFGLARCIHHIQSPAPASTIPWCSWLSHSPNTRMVAGSNPAGIIFFPSSIRLHIAVACLTRPVRQTELPQAQEHIIITVPASIIIIAVHLVAHVHDARAHSECERLWPTVRSWGKRLAGREPRRPVSRDHDRIVVVVGVC